MNETLKSRVLSLETTAILGDDRITLKAHPSGFVYWCSHWHLIEDLKRAGVVRSEKGPLHHRDYYLTDL